MSIDLTPKAPTFSLPDRDVFFVRPKLYRFMDRTYYTVDKEKHDSEYDRFPEFDTKDWICLGFKEDEHIKNLPGKIIKTEHKPFETVTDHCVMYQILITYQSNTNDIDYIRWTTNTEKNKQHLSAHWLDKNGKKMCSHYH
jgi:hypothetical protein